MNKVARVIFLVVGGVLPIFIGILHTITHYSQLVTPEISEFLQKEIIILGKSQPIWNTWGIVSFMMGISMIIIGLLNISTLRGMSKTDYVPLLSIISMILYQFCVVYVGSEFGQGFQFYGGVFGVIVLLVCLILTLKYRTFLRSA